MTNRKRLPWNKEYISLIFKRDGYECIYCGDFQNLSLDHIVPFSADGTEVASNIVVSCKTCNSKKHKNRLLPRLEKSVLLEVDERNRKFGIDPDLVLFKSVSLVRKKKLGKGRDRIGARSRMMLKRMDNIDSSVSIFCLLTDNEDEQRRMVQNCKHHGYEYFSVPTGVSKEKLVIVDGPVRGSWEISRHDAEEWVLSCVAVSQPGRESVVSGNLGLKK